MHKPVSMSHIKSTKSKRKKNGMRPRPSPRTKREEVKKKDFQIFTPALKCEVLPDSVRHVDCQLLEWKTLKLTSVRWLCLFMFVKEKKLEEKHHVWPPSNIRIFAIWCGFISECVLMYGLICGDFFFYSYIRFTVWNLAFHQI